MQPLPNIFDDRRVNFFELAEAKMWQVVTDAIMMHGGDMKIRLSRTHERSTYGSTTHVTLSREDDHSSWLSEPVRSHRTLTLINFHD